MNEPILSVKNVIKRFPGTVALKGVSFDLYNNQIVSLIGENGAGKSTLMKILSGVYPYRTYEGEVILNGEKCSFYGPADAEAAGIAMIYQELNLELDISLAENIVIGKYPQRRNGIVDWKKTKAIASELLQKVGLNIDPLVTARNLSPSMQQLVCIARALYREPKVLILDEPSSVLTENETLKLMDIIRNMRDSGICCIYISHKLEEVFKISDRVIVFRDGENICEYDKEKGFDSAAVIEAMIGRKLEYMYPARKPVSGEEVLRVEHFRVVHPFSYGKNIIEDVSLSLHKGEILGLAGLVGSGRSELLNAIFGYYPKSNGKLYLGHKEVKIDSPEEAIREGIGLLSEDRKKNGYIWSMNIRDNMTIVALKTLKKGLVIDKKRENNEAETFFEKLRIKAAGVTAMITSLSGGNQQKVIISKWLLSKAKILLLDEPTRGVDVGAKAEIYRLMQELTEEGVSIIMVSSEFPELIAMCDRILVLVKGTVNGEYGHGEATETMLMHVASGT